MGIIGKLIGLAITVAGAATVASSLAKKKEEKEMREQKIIRLEKELKETQTKDYEREKEIRTLKSVLKSKEEMRQNEHTKCKNCGTQNLYNASYCNLCGHELFVHKKSVTKYCFCCGAQLTGLQGHDVVCQYCNSKTTL